MQLVKDRQLSTSPVEPGEPVRLSGPFLSLLGKKCVSAELGRHSPMSENLLKFGTSKWIIQHTLKERKVSITAEVVRETFPVMPHSQ